MSEDDRKYTNEEFAIILRKAAELKRLRDWKSERSLLGRVLGWPLNKRATATFSTPVTQLTTDRVLATLRAVTEQLGHGEATPFSRSASKGVDALMATIQRTMDELAESPEAVVQRRQPE